MALWIAGSDNRGTVSRATKALYSKPRWPLYRAKVYYDFPHRRSYDSLWYSMFLMFNCVSPYFKTLMGKFYHIYHKNIKWIKIISKQRELLTMDCHILRGLLPLIPFLRTIHYSHQLFVHWLLMRRKMDLSSQIGTQIGDFLRSVI